MDVPAFISRIAALPTPPSVLRTIMDHAESRDKPLSELIEVIRFDPAIAGRILRAANAHSAGFPCRISSLQNAGVFLGRGRIYSLLLLSRHLTGSAQQTFPPFFTLEKFWRHSVLVALIAESIGRHMKRYEPLDEQELFSGGLLHDIGKIALATGNGGSLETARLRSVAGSLPFYKAEGSEPHAVVGALLAQAWGFPPELRHAAGGHHDPESAGDFRRFASIVHVADVMVHLVGYPVFDGEAFPPVDESALAVIPLPPERLKIIAEDGIKALQGLEKFYAIAS